jgi:hypothetical protein
MLDASSLGMDDHLVSGPLDGQIHRVAPKENIGGQMPGLASPAEIIVTHAARGPLANEGAIRGKDGDVRL